MGRPDPYYFDYSASEPPYREALEEYVKIAEKFSANPSSAHRAGKEAHRKLTEKKIEFCNLLGFTEGHLLLCGSATEANNTVLEGHRKRFPDGRILIAEDVHDSIWYATRKHRDHVDVLPRNSMADLTARNLDNYTGNGTTLVCINQVCNETGTIHQLVTLTRFCQARGIRLLVDGSQAAGHVEVNLAQLPFTYYSFSAHKFGGPRGVGGLLIRDRQFEPLLSGGNHEWGLRAGTENLAGLAAAVEALRISISGLKDQERRLGMLKAGLIRQLQQSLPELMINTPEESRPGFLSLSFPGFRGSELVVALSVSGFKIASGSACHASRVTPSRIILATGRTEKEAIGTIRITMGRGNTEESVEALGRSLLEILHG